MIPYPVLDPRDEDQIVADVLAALPTEFSDRNPSSPVVKVVEAVGAFYGLLSYRLNTIPMRLQLALLNLIGVEPAPASAATVTLTFTSAVGTIAPIVVPAGTIARTGFDVFALEFETTIAVSVPQNGGTATVEARALTLGANTNAGSAAITLLSQPIAGIASVTNVSAASGGQDAETVEATIARAPATLRAAGDRAITAADIELLSAAVPGVIRARTLAATYINDTFDLLAGAGAVVVGILAADLNASPSSALTEDVRDYLLARTTPGALIVPYQHPVRLLWVSTVELALETGVTALFIAPAVEAALAAYLDAATWDWGAPLFENDLVVQLARVSGVRRVGVITVRTSDDYGATWVAPVPLVSVAPGLALPADLTDAWGLLHWGAGYGTPGALTITVI